MTEFCYHSHCRCYREGQDFHDTGFFRDFHPAQMAVAEVPARAKDCYRLDLEAPEMEVARAETAILEALPTC